MIHLEPAARCFQDDAGATVVDYIARYESLNEDFDEVINIINKRRSPGLEPLKPTLILKTVGPLLRKVSATVRTARNAERNESRTPTNRAGPTQAAAVFYVEEEGVAPAFWVMGRVPAAGAGVGAAPGAANPRTRRQTPPDYTTPG